MTDGKTMSFASGEKLQMFVERYLELSSELKYRKGEGQAYMQLGEIMAQKGDYDQGTRNFYRAMKIAEEMGEEEVKMKEKAKVSFGMANANLKWDKHQEEVLDKVKNTGVEGNLGQEDSDSEEAIDGKEKLPAI